MLTLEYDQACFTFCHLMLYKIFLSFRPQTYLLNSVACLYCLVFWCTICFYRVIETGVEVWENDKCCGNTSWHVFFDFFQTVTRSSIYNSIETQRSCFLFLLDNSATKTKNTTCLLWSSKFKFSDCLRYHYINNSCYVDLCFYWLSV